MNNLLFGVRIDKLFCTAVVILSMTVIPLRAEQSFVSLNNESTKSNLASNQLDLSEFTQVGKAKFSFMFWDIYNSYLYSSTGEYEDSSSQSIVFKIQYLRDITRDDLVDNTVEQWQHIGVKKGQYQSYVSILSTLWPDIRKGDELALYVTPHHSTFFFNNTLLGHVEDEQFGQLFIDIWLSDKTSQPELRRQLLGQN